MGNLSRTALDKKERRIPVAASGALRAAMESTLEAGHSVLVVDDGKLIRLLPNGKREFVKRVGKRVPVERSGWTTFRWLTTFPE